MTEFTFRLNSPPEPAAEAPSRVAVASWPQHDVQS
jgi:hypothetical protein